MRKLISYTLIVLFFFNLLGYYGLFFGLQYQNDRRMMRALDSDSYNESEAVTIKIPITVPYAADYQSFERVNGTFEHNGESYRMVKQKLVRDTLLIVCIKDHARKSLNDALTNFVKTFSDQPVGTQSNSKVLSDTGFIKDYVLGTFTLNQSASGWVSVIASKIHLNQFISDYYPSIVHPPESCS